MQFTLCWETETSKTKEQFLWTESTVNCNIKEICQLFLYSFFTETCDIYKEQPPWVLRVVTTGFYSNQSLAVTRFAEENNNS